MESDAPTVHGVDACIAISRKYALPRSFAPVLSGAASGTRLVFAGAFPVSVAFAALLALLALGVTAPERRMLGLARARLAAEYPDQAREAAAKVDEMRKHTRFRRGFDG